VEASAIYILDLQRIPFTRAQEYRGGTHMSDQGEAMLRRHCLLRRASVAVVCFLVLMTGCKTTEDAAAASSQMSATAKSLCDYYAALGSILESTDQIRSLNEAVYAKPYSAANRKELKVTQDELAKRVAISADLSTLAGSFAKLTGSAAPADVAAEGSNLATEVSGLASYTVSAAQQSAIETALKLFVTAVLARKDHEAAQAMDSLAVGLCDLFDKEANTWQSIDNTYLEVAANLAGDLADQSAVDHSALLRPALEPFGLAPSVPAADLNVKLTPIAKQQIDARKTAALKSYKDASDAMSNSLHDMSQRIHLVATGRPMAFRIPPVNLVTVEQWANTVMSHWEG
jgi:hypothetical protein